MNYIANFLAHAKSIFKIVLWHKFKSVSDFQHRQLGRMCVCWYSDGCGFDPRVWQHSFVETGHEIISTAILFLPLIQVGQLSVTGERMCT